MRMFFSLILMLLAFGLSAKTVYLVPMRGYDETKLYFERDFHPFEMFSRPFCALREEIEKMGFEVKFTHDCQDLEEFTAIISFEAHEDVLLNLTKYPKDRCFLICWDPPMITPWSYEEKVKERFQKIFVMLDDLVDNVSYFKFYCPMPQSTMLPNIPNFSEKKLCSMIASNKEGYEHSLYAERWKMIFFFEGLCRNHGINDFDLYGIGYDGWLLWKGMVSNKWEVFKHYKFAVCYENSKNVKGYITEKIFDCMAGGCVPIYLGADNITDDVPKECFIDRRDFFSNEDVYHFIKNMDEHTYNGYIQSIGNYMQSEHAKLHSIESFVKLITDELTKLSP